MVWLAVVTLTLVVQEALGYGNGAPARQCDRMYPGHGLAAQVSPSPYTIQLSRNSFSCSGDEVTVTLSGSTPFRGFICQPRPNPEVYATSGLLASDGSDGVMKKDICGSSRSLTHVNKDDKTSITFTWKPTTADSIYIVCTVVGRYRTFWVKQRSEQISFVRKECRPGGAGTTVPPGGGASSGGSPNTGTTLKPDDSGANTQTPNTATSTGSGTNTGPGGKPGGTKPDTSTTDTNSANNNMNGTTVRSGNDGNNAAGSSWPALSCITWCLLATIAMLC